MQPSAISTNVLQSVHSLECKGRLKFFWRNCYTYVQVDDVFSSIPLQTMGPLGYEEVPLMSKEGSPKTHVTVMSATERNHMPRWRLRNVINKWKNQEIDFEIEGVESWYHTRQGSGQNKWVYVFKIESKMIRQIRLELGLQPFQEYYNMHMTLCEKSA